MMYGALVRKRESVLCEIRNLRKRHRKRKPLLRIAVRLTMQQIIQEMRATK